MATTVANSRSFWGMIIYEITGDGTLHGTWKENRSGNADSIMNEIARKRDGNNDNSIVGTYTTAWIEADNQARTGTLTIAQIENNTAFSFIWEGTKRETFRGVGMPIGINRIAVTYWNTTGVLELGF